MAMLTAAVLLAVVLPSGWAHREGAGSQSRAASESLLAAATAAGMSASQLYDAVRDGVHSNLQECKESQEHVLAQESVQKMEHCVNAIASFAQKTQTQRQRSLKANQNYADDLILAKKLLKYLVKQTDTQEHQFREFQNSEKQKRTDIEAMLSQRRPEGQRTGPLLAQDLFRPGVPGAPASLMAMYAQATPVGYQASQATGVARTPQTWANMAAVYSASGQNFGVPMPPTSPGGLVGRRPSQLEVETTPVSSDSLQAKLDNEAEKLEENDAGDLQG